jgi:hypothetical protein
VNIEWSLVVLLEGTPRTDSVKDGRVSDFINENIVEEQGIEMLPPEVKHR